MTNILIVHQSINPTAGGAYTLQAEILNEVSSYHTEGINVFTAPASIINREIAVQVEKKFNINLVWYLFPLKTKHLFDVPYIATIWDLGHRNFPVFPELTVSGWTFENRDEAYRGLLSAFRIFVGSENLRGQLISAYGFERNRIIVNPFPAPSLPLLNEPIKNRIESESPIQTRILFYPAQFWAHKNHVNLVKALQILETTKGTNGLVYELHLTGSDQGNESFIRDQARSLGLNKKIFFHGFVDQAEISSLYDRAFALTYPSLLGPDNLPPLEAMSRGCPVATADIEGAREVYGDSALYFDPLDAVDIANKIRSLESEELRFLIMENGRYLAASRSSKKHVETIFNEIKLFRRYRELFPA
jgi:glycosyltransferase involved in cell wall biosynthesis